MSAPMTAQPGAASDQAGTDITVARPVEHFHPRCSCPYPCRKHNGHTEDCAWVVQDTYAACDCQPLPEQAYGCPLCADSGEYEPGRLCNCSAGSALYFLLTETEDKHHDR